MIIDIISRSTSLFLALLMITAAFIPAVNAMETYEPETTDGWDWSVDGWNGWNRYATTCLSPWGSGGSWVPWSPCCIGYGPRITSGPHGIHGEHGVSVSSYQGNVRSFVEYQFTDPTGFGWNNLTFVGRVSGSDRPWGRWMTIEVNNVVVYSESGFEPGYENSLPKEFHADFPQTDSVRVKISHGQDQNQASNVIYFMEFYSLELSSDSPPCADFIANPLSGPAPLEVQFDDTSTGSPNTWAWDFNGDGITDSTEQNPSYIYTIPGVYNVSLTVGNAYGEDSSTKNDYTNVAPPAIEIHSPIDDTVASGNITVAGNVSDTAITDLTLIHNGVEYSIPVQDGSFSTMVNLVAINNITIRGIDPQGNPISRTILLDGDMLPAASEMAIGFDPLNPNSDCIQTEYNESTNDLPDGYELLDGELPVFAKIRTGYDPLLNDTDGDGLSDSFELLKLGVFPDDSAPEPLFYITQTNPTTTEFIGNNAGVEDDPDSDGVSNLDEQAYGTDPLSADTDSDGLPDAYEIDNGLDPLSADPDGDLLPDGVEIQIGTNPILADNGTYHQISESYFNESVGLNLYGPAYALSNVSVAEVNYTHLISDDILVSGVYDLSFDENVRCDELRIKYNSASATNSSDLSIYRFDDDLGTFMQVSNVSLSGDTVTCTAINASKYAVLIPSKWDALFEDPAMEIEYTQSGYAQSQEIYLDNEQYFPAIDEGYPVTAPPEAELIEGVDYGASSSNETPEWLTDEWDESETQSEIEENEITESVQYQAVSNGDFSDGLANWAPNGSVSYYLSGRGHDINTYNEDYYSPSQCLSIQLRNDGKNIAYHSYTVAHANVDLTGVNELTFKYKCKDFERGSGLDYCRMEFWIDNTYKSRYPNGNDYPIIDNYWQSASIDVSGDTGMHKISFKVYLNYGNPSQYNEESIVQFLIDDVSALSAQQPAEPDTANVRFFVRDSQTNQGVSSASVTCNNEIKHADYNGYTNDFFLTSNGAYGYSISCHGYKPHDGIIKVTAGESKIAYAVINQDSAPTGTLYVSSNPYPADIYVDDIYCDGTNDHVYDLLAGPHSVGIIKEGYNYAEKTVEVVSNQITDVHFNLTDESGTVQVISSPTEARVYVDNDYQCMTSSTGILELPCVPVGDHQITVMKDGYAPYVGTVTVEKDQTVSVIATLNNDDEEGDGLLDDYEENGFRDGFGNHHTTDPTLIDTDGDGLSDGYEAGFQITDANGRSYLKQRSDATKADTDDDGLDDFWEDYLGTDPYDPDTDHDFVRDGDDDDPLIPTYNTAINDAIRDQVALRLGTIFGETGLRGEICYDLIGGDTYSSTPPYVSGWIISGIAVYGDVRQ